MRTAPVLSSPSPLLLPIRLRLLLILLVSLLPRPRPRIRLCTASSSPCPPRRRRFGPLFRTYGCHRSSTIRLNRSVLLAIRMELVSISYAYFDPGAEVDASAQSSVPVPLDAPFVVLSRPFRCA